MILTIQMDVAYSNTHTCEASFSAPCTYALITQLLFLLRIAVLSVPKGQC